MTDSRGKAAPGAGDTHRGLALSFGGSLGGTPLTSYSKAKGRRTGRYRAPFSFLKVPHHPEEDQQWGQRNCGLARAGNSRGHRDIRRPEPAAKEAAEALVRHILNWGSEEKAPPKQGLGAEGVRGRGFRSRTIRDTRASSRKKSPAEAGHKHGNGKHTQTAQSFERQGRRPSALGHDGRWRWIFANRSLADRPLANRRRRRRRRLPARQVGSGGSAQHRQGCSQRS